MSTPLKVTLVNDYEIVLAGIREMLTPHADRVQIVDAGETPLDQVDIVLHDTYGQDLQSWRVARRSSTAGHAPKVVLFTWNCSPELTRLALSHGVDAVISKTLDAPQLVEHLERVAAGERGACPACEQQTDVEASSPQASSWPGRPLGLSMREAEMITLISQGLTNVEIAEHTDLSPNSVKSYIRSAYRKIGVTQRSQAVAWGIDHGMVPDRASATH
ncbi:LuxR C-terminal-related transcriptional regulator [Luteococcus sp. Sow4_B9]|uniref:LuxR C-terminal-related transcriptional regulator n=1 Tax=Luteococcus sp. Sow4_B9 TaxID=3438792 RepID=UPI003F9B2970